VDRPSFANDAEEPLDELLPLEVHQIAKHDASAEMGVAIGVAPWTSERTFTSDLDGKVGLVTGEDVAPRPKHSVSFHGGLLDVGENDSQNGK